MSARFERANAGFGGPVGEATLNTSLDVDFADPFLLPNRFNLVADFVGKPDFVGNGFDQNKR